VAKVAVAGQDNSALNAVDAAPATPVADLPKSGEEAFGKICTTCHTAGLAGAPKMGDKAAWAPRIAQGKDTLYKHAINGFSGEAGVMPARGGTNWPDELIKLTVDHMVQVNQ
jgi:cytochrome c5